MSLRPIQIAVLASALPLLVLGGCGGGGGDGGDDGMTPPGTNEAPMASISSPADEANFDQGTTVTLEGSATDPEDGTLSGDALTWESDVDGEIGTGETVAVDDLLVGHHVVTLTAVDGDGATDTARTGLRIRPPGEAITVDLAIADNVFLDLQERENENAFVRIRLGDTVRWTYDSGSTTHTVTSGEGEGGEDGAGIPEGASTSMDSPVLRPGDLYTFTPDAPGTWTYYCEVHPGVMMEAVVEVTP